MTNPYNRTLPVGDLNYKSKLANSKSSRPWDMVEAMLEYGEADLLYDIPAMLNKSAHLNIANLGDGPGGSSIILARGLKDRGLNGTVHTVDLYRDHKRHKERNTALYVQNGVGDYIVQYRGLTSVIGRKIKEEGLLSFDFLFIDASHAYHNVCSDIKLWVPMVKFGGLVAAHDTNQDDVDRAIKDTLPSEWSCFMWINRTKVFKNVI